MYLWGTHPEEKFQELFHKRYFLDLLMVQGPWRYRCFHMECLCDFWPTSIYSSCPKHIGNIVAVRQFKSKYIFHIPIHSYTYIIIHLGLG